MTYFASCFLVSLLALFIMRSSMRHGHLSADHDLRGPAEVSRPPVAASGWRGSHRGRRRRCRDRAGQWVTRCQGPGLLIACSLPAFAAGITEDLTKSVSPRRRLFATAIAAGLAIWLLGAVVTRTDVPGIDQQIRWAPISVLLTVFVVTGVANAVNIIDGFNGLASMCVLMMMMLPSPTWRFRWTTRSFSQQR